MGRWRNALHSLHLNTVRRSGPLKCPLKWLTAAAVLLTTGAAIPSTDIPSSEGEDVIPARSLRADLIIHVPIIIPGDDVIVVPRRRLPEARQVTVEFIAEGDDWAKVYLDNRLLFQAFNTPRRHVVELTPGAYELEITGVTRFEVWDSGYLDVGREDANVLVIRYSKHDGVRANDPDAWIPNQ